RLFRLGARRASERRRQTDAALVRELLQALAGASAARRLCRTFSGSAFHDGPFAVRHTGAEYRSRGPHTSTSAFRPAPFSSYSARSAFLSTSSGRRVVASRSARPMLTVTRT